MIADEHKMPKDITFLCLILCSTNPNNAIVHLKSNLDVKKNGEIFSRNWAKDSITSST